jgi:hypothetical protein
MGMNPKDMTITTYGYDSATETHDITQTTVSKDVTYNEDRTQKTVSVTKTTTTTTVQRVDNDAPVVNTTQTTSSHETTYDVTQTDDPEGSFTGSTVETVSNPVPNPGESVVNNNPDLSGSEFDDMNAAVGELTKYVTNGGGATKGGNWITDTNSFQESMDNIGMGMTVLVGTAAIIELCAKGAIKNPLSIPTAITGVAVLGLSAGSKYYNKRNVDNIRLRIPR